MNTKKVKTFDDGDLPDVNEEDSNDSGSESESDNSMENEEIQVDFEGRNPTDEDFDGINQLLRQLFLKAHINLNEMTNIIISQDYVGSVMKQTWDEEMDDEDDYADVNVAFGVTTVVNISHRKDLECIKQFKAVILKKAEENASDNALKLFRDVLNSDQQSVGFLINERYVNIPAQISVPMMENLLKEITRAVEKDKPFRFSYYIMILKFYRKAAKENRPVEDIFSNPEEELFAKESLSSFDYSVKSEIDSGLDGKWKEEDEEMEPLRKVVLIDSKKFVDICGSINNFIKGNI